MEVVFNKRAYFSGEVLSGRVIVKNAEEFVLQPSAISCSTLAFHIIGEEEAKLKNDAPKESFRCKSSRQEWKKVYEFYFSRTYTNGHPFLQFWSRN